MTPGLTFIVFGLVDCHFGSKPIAVDKNRVNLFKNEAYLNTMNSQ